MKREERLLDNKLSKILKEAIIIMKKLGYISTSRNIGKNYATIEYRPKPKKCSKCGNVIVEEL